MPIMISKTVKIIEQSTGFMIHESKEENNLSERDAFQQIGYSRPMLSMDDILDALVAGERFEIKIQASGYITMITWYWKGANVKNNT